MQRFRNRKRAVRVISFLTWLGITVFHFAAIEGLSSIVVERLMWISIYVIGLLVSIKLYAKAHREARNWENDPVLSLHSRNLLIRERWRIGMFLTGIFTGVAAFLVPIFTIPIFFGLSILIAARSVLDEIESGELHRAIALREAEQNDAE